MSKKSSTIDTAEVEKFSKLAQEWWNEKGSFKPLHEINPTRLTYIRDQICFHFQLDTSKKQPLKGLKILDVGCGGGLISVPIHNLGASVTALDASQENIKTAEIYSLQKGYNIRFIHSPIETLPETEKFDAILALEIIEHVSDFKAFLKHLSCHLNDNGVLIISTINRSLRSLLFAKFAAEYILKILPIGTHDWDKFLKPEEITSITKKLGLNTNNLRGLSFRPFSSSKWILSDDTSINYFLTLSKKH